MKVLFPILFSFAVIAVTGCNKMHNPSKNFTLCDFIEFDGNGMTPDVEYMLNPFDSISKEFIDKDFSLSLDIRYNEGCEIRTLPLIIQYPDLLQDTIVKKEISMPLFNKEDRAMGIGNYGIYESNLLLIDNIKSSDTFFISISTREPHTSGIISIGVIGLHLNT